MGRGLNEIRIVDLQRTNVDWKKSDTEHGKYVFIDKPVYVDYRSDAAPLPDHKVQWINQDHIDIYRYKHDYDLVRHVDKLYWPEGIVPNAEGGYQYRDTRLMMCPAHLYVERKKAALERSLRASRGRTDGIREEARRDGVEIEITDETERRRR